jgi:adenylate kinase
MKVFSSDKTDQGGRNIMQLVLLGAPGAGKGTQGELLEKKLSLPRIASGDLIRQAMVAGTQLGAMAKAYVTEGNLVPDQLVTGLMEERLADDDVKSGFILDGFPRTVAQAQALAEFLIESGRGPVQAIYLEVEESTLLKRLSGRRFCSHCGASFHLTGRPPKEEGICDLCGSKLVQRPDDSENVIRNRLQVYRRETEPVLDFYAQRGLLQRVDGNGDLEAIFTRLVTALGEDGL